MDRQNMLEHLEETQEKNVIPFLGGRPERETIISEDDITNLKINLNITKSVEEFLTIL